MVTRPTSASPDPRVVPILRLALLGGTGLLGGVIGFLRSPTVQVEQEMANTLTLIGRGIWGSGPRRDLQFAR